MPVVPVWVYQRAFSAVPLLISPNRVSVELTVSSKRIAALGLGLFAWHTYVMAEDRVILGWIYVLASCILKGRRMAEI